MKVGIVGSSKATYDQAHEAIELIINSYPLDTTFISGGAKGIDNVVKLICAKLNRNIIEMIPKQQNWAEFKKRNLLIAKHSDVVISVALKFSGNPCYHCNNSTHDKTAGCYTLKHAKKGRVVVLK